MGVFENKKILPLHALSAGETAVVVEVSGGLNFTSRISATGFTRNAEVIMLQNWKWEPVIVFIRDTQMALGRSEAGRIMVRKKA